MNAQPTIQTARLTLRPFALSDGPRLKELVGDHAIADTTGSIKHPYEDGMAERWIAKQRAEFETGAASHLAVTLRESGELVGGYGLTVAAAHHRAELGYWIGKPYWSRGYATEAGRAMLRHGFSDLGLARIIAHHMSRNPASGGVLRKLGMTQEGVLRKHFYKWDKPEDSVCYGILREEWETVPTTRNDA